MKQVHVGHTKLHLPQAIHLSEYSFHTVDFIMFKSIPSGTSTLVSFSSTNFGETSSLLISTASKIFYNS